MRHQILVWTACILTSAGALGQPSECQPQRFTATVNGRSQQFDVRELRTTRPDLYRLVGTRFFLESAYGEAGTAMFRPNFAAPFAAAGSDERFKKLWDFVNSETIPRAIRRMYFACGSEADLHVAHLSLRLSPAEGERLVELLSNPVVEKLVDFMPYVPGLSPSPDLRISSEQAWATSIAEVADACKRAGVAAEICEALPTTARPPRAR